MPVVINYWNKSNKYESFFLLQNCITFRVDKDIEFREIANNDSSKIKFSYFKSENDSLKCFNFLMELLKNNPAVIVDMKSLIENTDDYINNFYEKKNQ